MSWLKITSNFLFVYGFFSYSVAIKANHIFPWSNLYKDLSVHSEDICISWPTVGCARMINHLSLSMFVIPIWPEVQGYGFCGKIPRPSQLLWNILTGQHLQEVLQKDLFCMSGMHDILAAKWLEDRFGPENCVVGKDTLLHG